MLSLNIGLPKTPHGLSIDRCLKPCPGVIPDTDQPRLQPRPLSPDPVLPQCWPSQDYWVSTCFLVSVMGWSQSSFTRWQAPPIPPLVGVSSNGVAFWVIPKITGGFGVIAPFTECKKTKTDKMVWYETFSQLQCQQIVFKLKWHKNKARV